MHSYAYRCDSTAASEYTEGYRIDRALTGLKPKEKTAEGVIFEGWAARPGIYCYRDPDGSIRRELVTADMLAKSAPGLVGQPLTLHHPASRRVDASNRDKLEVGKVLDAQGDQATGRLWVRLLVTRQDALDAIDGGLTGLSPGYLVKIDSKAGNDPLYGAYDLRQAGRTYNHLALCGGMSDPARGGATTALRVDAETEIAPEQPATENHMRHLLAIAMLMGIRTDSFAEDDEAGIAAAVKAGVEGLKGRVDAAEAAKTQAETDLSDASARADSEFLDRFKAHSEALTVAERYDVSDVDGKTTTEIQRAVVLKAVPGANAQGSDDYFAAAFDLVKAQRSDSERKVGKGIQAPPQPQAARADADEKITYGSQAWLAGFSKARSV